MENTLRVPVYLAPEDACRQFLPWLGDYVYLGNYGESQLRLGILGEDGQVRSMNGGKVNEQFLIRYDPHIGYQTNKRRE